MNERLDCPSSSSLDRIVQCSASHNMGLLAESSGQSKESLEDAEFGLRVHKALQNGTAKELSTDDERLAFSAMFRQSQRFCFDWVHASDEPVEEFSEHRMWMHHGITPVFTGQADKILIQGKRALIIDYKSLWNRVAEPLDNHQLKSLAVLLWISSDRRLEEITIQIISPHYTYTHYVMHPEELMFYVSFLESAIQSVNQAAVPIAGEHCKHCRGLLICPAVRKKASDLLKADKDGDIVAHLPSGAAGAKVLDELTAISSMIDRIRDHYKEVLIEDHKAIPGWSLQSHTTKKFTDTRQVFNMLGEKFSAGVFDFVSISVSKAMLKLSRAERETLDQYVEKTVSTHLRKGKTKNGPEEV